LDFQIPVRTAIKTWGAMRSSREEMIFILIYYGVFWIFHESEKEIPDVLALLSKSYWNV
jgi:hypothetical protein